MTLFLIHIIIILLKCFCLLVTVCLLLPGDFAVLLKAGMTVRQAILYNVLSAMMAYLGMVTGILIGHYAENISMWIFALTAGLFMYVALVDMVSQRLVHLNAPQTTKLYTLKPTGPHNLIYFDKTLSKKHDFSCRRYFLDAVRNRRFISP